jgi:hypothetical protein
MKQRIAATGFDTYPQAENVAGGQGSALEVAADWMCSEGHRGNIMSCSVDSVGTATAYDGNGRAYYVQVSHTVLQTRAWGDRAPAPHSMQCICRFLLRQLPYMQIMHWTQVCSACGKAELTRRSLAGSKPWPGSMAELA